MTDRLGRRFRKHSRGPHGRCTVRSSRPIVLLEAKGSGRLYLRVGRHSAPSSSSKVFTELRKNRPRPWGCTDRTRVVKIDRVYCHGCATRKITIPRVRSRGQDLAEKSSPGKDTRIVISREKYVRALFFPTIGAEDSWVSSTQVDRRSPMTLEFSAGSTIRMLLDTS